MPDIEKPVVKCRITDITEESPTVKTFEVDKRFEDAQPGQFAMVGLLDGDEIPLSFSNKSSFTVKKVA